MNLYEAMATQRAIRRLKPDPIPHDVLSRIFQAASWAPTGGNVQPFRMVAVTDRDKLKSLGELYTKQWAVYTEGMRAEGDALAPARKKMMLAGDYLCEHLHQVPVMVVFCFNAEHMAITDAGLDRPSVVGGGSVYTAVQNLMLAARAEGVGCVLTTLLCFEESAVKSLLEIPDPWGTCAHLPMGYPVLGGYGPTSRRPLSKMLYENTWMASSSFEGGA